MNNPQKIRMTVLATAIAAAFTLANAQDATLYESHIFPEAIVFEPTSTVGLNTDIEMIVKGPDGFVESRSFLAGEPIEFNPAGLPDGTYRYELQIVDIKSVSAQRGDHGAIDAVQEIPQPGFGSFAVREGKALSRETDEPGYTATESGLPGPNATKIATHDSDRQTRDQVIADDLIVDGSACIGMDCVNGESFGFDTLRLKENNTRIKFDDTSNSASFPNNDWQLTANESNNGGLNKFSIENTTIGRIPFTIEGPAPSNSLYVDDGGRIGMGTSAPVVQAHMIDGNTPTFRLHQDGSDGFQSQVWDVAGNEANFFVRDVTNGSALPFKILPGAPSDALVIEAGGNLGVGIRNSDASLHVRKTDPKILIESSSATPAQRTLLELSNAGKTRFILRNTDAGSTWTFDNSGATFDISRAGTGVAEFKLEEDGDAVFTGSVTANGVVLSSSRTVKTEITPVDSEQILEKVMNLPVHSWRYTSDQNNSEHIGPMAEDFHELFGIGSERHINLIDTTGITIAALQAVANDYRKHVNELNEKLQSQTDKVSALEQRIDQLSARLANPETQQ